MLYSERVSLWLITRPSAAHPPLTYEEKRSRFIATAAFADTEEKALAVLNAVRAANRTARHNVYAYVLQNGRTRYSDDGEPAKTAGTPVLETIGHAGVADVIVVVTRYFGGILLGTGGLVRAYTAAASGALQNAELVSMRLVVDCRLRVPYAQFEQAQRIIAAAETRLDEPIFDDAVTLCLAYARRAGGHTCHSPDRADPRRRRGGDLRGTVRGVLNCGAPQRGEGAPPTSRPRSREKTSKKFPQKKSVSRSFVVFINRGCKKGGHTMTIREETEAIERRTLSRYATLSENSLGRRTPLEDDPIRPCFQRDRDRILHCKAFRRLKQKTQVFLSPEGDHYRTRLTHTLEVAQIARTISRALRLNEDLTEAIALGHDLGHTPFGHAGERALNRLCPGGFTHYRQSLRVVDYLERDGQGLNLTWEVRNGIVTHTSGAWARTPEGCVVRRADHIAFLNHDIEDAITAGVLDARQLPPEATAVLGATKSQRITTMITDLIVHSGEGQINFSPEVEAAYAILKDFMYSTVYVDKEAKREEKKVDKLISRAVRPA